MTRKPPVIARAQSARGNLPVRGALSVHAAGAVLCAALFAGLPGKGRPQDGPYIYAEGFGPPQGRSLTARGWMINAVSGRSVSAPAISGGVRVRSPIQKRATKSSISGVKTTKSSVA